MSVPFVCNIIGTLADNGELFESRDGVAMRSFELHSPSRYFVKCMAYGYNACLDIFEVGMEVAIYSAAARQCMRGEKRETLAL